MTDPKPPPTRDLPKFGSPVETIRPEEGALRSSFSQSLTQSAPAAQEEASPLPEAHDGEEVQQASKAATPLLIEPSGGVSAWPDEAQGPEDTALPPLRLAKNPSEAGDFVLLATLGQGGRGVVHLAHQRSLQRDVALKQVRPDREATEELHEELLQEARVVGRLTHPNIIPVHALGAETDGGPVLVMRRVQGVSWRTLRKDPKHPHWLTVRMEPLLVHIDILRQVCHAIEYAHSKGVLHRDLKTDNVMIGAFGEVYVLDWGIAYPLRGPKPQQVAGTPAYMAPEMLAKERLDERTDVYLLGAILCEILTGESRHKGADWQELATQILTSAPVAFSETAPWELAELLNNATARLPAQRPASVRAFREALEDYLAHRSAMELTEEAFAPMKALTSLQKQLVEPTATTEEKAQERELRTHFAQARFALEGALRIWPKNPVARHTLQRLLRTMLRFELSQRRLDDAQHLYETLDSPDPGLAVQLEALRASLAGEEARSAALEERARGYNPRVRARSRAAFLLGFGLFGGLLWLLFRPWLQSPHLRDHYVASLSIGVILVLLLTIVIFVTRKRWQHPLSQKLLLGAWWINIVSIGFRGLGWTAGLPHHLTTSFELLLVLFAVVLFGVFVSRLHALSALWLPVGIFCNLRFPGAWVECSLGSIFAMLLTLGIFDLLARHSLTLFAWDPHPHASTPDTTQNPHRWENS